MLRIFAVILLMLWATIASANDPLFTRCPANPDLAGDQRCCCDPIIETDCSCTLACTGDRFRISNVVPANVKWSVAREGENSNLKITKAEQDTICNQVFSTGGANGWQSANHTDLTFTRRCNTNAELDGEVFDSSGNSVPNITAKTFNCIPKQITITLNDPNIGYHVNKGDMALTNNDGIKSRTGAANNTSTKTIELKVLDGGRIVSSNRTHCFYTDYRFNVDDKTTIESMSFYDVRDLNPSSFYLNNYFLGSTFAYQDKRVLFGYQSGGSKDESYYYCNKPSGKGIYVPSYDSCSEIYRKHDAKTKFNGNPNASAMEDYIVNGTNTVRWGICIYSTTLSGKAHFRYKFKDPQPVEILTTYTP
ncbi:MAG: hypothetical protein AAF153_02200 [Pseudomonadota bacterium]